MTGGYSVIQHSSVVNILCMIITQLHIRHDKKWLSGNHRLKLVELGHMV